MSLQTAKKIHAAVAEAGSNVATLVAKYGTPFYLYSAEVIRQQYRTLRAALAAEGLAARTHIYYAVKANDRLGILRVLGMLGAGADLVSIGEHHRATRANIAPTKQVFSGVGKSRAELMEALQNKIGQINVESLPELHMIADCAQALGMVARVTVRLNPDTRAGGHAYISTGSAEHKFGLSPRSAAAAIAEAQASPHLEAVGVAIHIGSQIVDIAPFAAAFARVNSFLAEIGFDPNVIDLGGGFAIDYTAGEPIFNLADYAKTVKTAFGARRATLFLEPGRFLVAHAGVLVFQTLIEKQAAHIRWVIGDMAMNDLLRPALYQAQHRLSVLSTLKGEASTANIAGPVCESTDRLEGQYALPPCPEGTLLALHDVGAYGSVMSMAYNARRLPPEVLLDGTSVHTLRRAITAQDFLAFED
ncbi:MAG: diaminopimelate decarboxylase [Alphaproteobacteria bacterium]|nr:diaminopimelate decarboxylase [Alphaproteobacteria bacterium]